MKVNDVILEYYDPEDDEASVAHKDDTRRPRLTLKHLHKLRKMREVRKLEQEEHLVLVRDMYNTAPADDQGFAG